MIIDSHCHAGKGDGLTGPWDTAAPLGKYLRRASRAGIDRTVLFPAFHSDYAVANREVARIVASPPDRFYGFAFVHPDRDRGRVFTMVKAAVEQYGLRGIKVHRYDGRITREICEVARAFSLPVLYDVMGEVSVVELLAREYPDVIFIIPHLGSFADDWRAQLALIDHLVRHPNVYTDTSGIRRFDLLQEAVRRAGAGKVLFGTDSPWLHPGVELVKVRVLDARDCAALTIQPYPRRTFPRLRLPGTAGTGPRRSANAAGSPGPAVASLGVRYHLRLQSRRLDGLVSLQAKSRGQHLLPAGQARAKEWNGELRLAVLFEDEGDRGKTKGRPPGP